MNAQRIVNRLLEMSAYDIDDPLDQPSEYDYPAGFVARNDPERVEWRLEPAPGSKTRFEYRMSKWWLDDYTGKLRVIKAAHQPVRDSDEAQRWIEQEMKKWSDAGWKVEVIR
jgi:hypothetical protein